MWTIIKSALCFLVDVHSLNLQNCFSANCTVFDVHCTKHSHVSDPAEHLVGLFKGASWEGDRDSRDTMAENVDMNIDKSIEKNMRTTVSNTFQNPTKKCYQGLESWENKEGLPQYISHCSVIHFIWPKMCLFRQIHAVCRYSEKNVKNELLYGKQTEQRRPFTKNKHSSACHLYFYPHLRQKRSCRSLGLIFRVLLEFWAVEMFFYIFVSECRHRNRHVL